MIVEKCVRALDGRLIALLYSQREINCAMSDQHEGHFPEEAEQNEIGGPVLVALLCVAAAIIVIWAAC